MLGRYNNLSHSSHSACLEWYAQERLYFKQQNQLTRPLSGASPPDSIISDDSEVVAAFPGLQFSNRVPDFLGTPVMADNDSLECLAREMIRRFGAEAAHIARELGKSAEERKRTSAQSWHDIADAIDRVISESMAQ